MSGGLASWLSILGVVLTLGIQAAPASAAQQCAPTPGAVIQLAGTPHLFIVDGQRVLHWGGDTRALAGQSIDWNNVCTVGLNELRAMQRGDPWLSSGLPKIGEPIYLSKWEDTDPAPTLLHIQSIADVELFGINERNYGNFVLDRPAWEQRFGFNVGDLQVGPLASAASFAWPPQDQTSYGRLLDNMKGVLGAQLFRGVQAGIDAGLLLPGIAQCERAGLNEFERGRNPASAMGATQDCLARLNVGGPPGPGPIPGPGLGLPFTPPNLHVLAISPTQIRVDWDDVPNAAGYRIFGGDQTTPANTVVTTTPAGSSVQDISGRVPATVYCYAVTAFNPVGESPMSPSVCAQTPGTGTTGLNPPTNLTISQISIGQGVSGLRLSWTDTSTSETGFQIMRGDQQLATIAAGSTTYSDMSWTSDLPSCYRVVAVNDVGTATSDQACLTTSGTDVPPSAPTNVHAVLTPGVAGVQLTWTDTSTTETGFQVMRDDQAITTLGPNSTSYTDPSWNPQSPSCYRVVAFNAFGPSTSSDRVCPAAVVIGQPSAPANLVVTRLQGGQAVRLNWADTSSNEDGFQILRNNLMIASVASSVSTFTDANPEQGQNCYRIAAYNSTGAGYSSQVCR